MTWRNRFRLGRLARNRREQDIDREIRAHVDLEAEEQREAGMTDREAWHAAARLFGNRRLVAEDVRAIWRRPWLDSVRQDVRYALRTMRRDPGFAVIAVGSSALGIGACSVIFAIVNFALFRPLPVHEPERLMSVSEVNRRTGEAGDVLSYLDFLDVRRALSFEGIAAVDPLLPASIGLHDDPQRHFGALVSANYFEVVKPVFAVGRGFDVIRDDTRGESPVVVLSHDLCHRYFGSDPAVIGRSISINGRAATIVGVTAAGFRGTQPGIRLEFWIPFSMVDEVEARSGPVTQNRRRFWLDTVARLRPGVDEQAARAELGVVAQNLNAAFDRKDRGFHVERAGQLDPQLRRMALRLFSIALCVTTLVLVTACSNVANLLLGRASARRREIAARMALGAGRFRVIRQLLTESLLLALMGGAGAWIIASYVTSLLGLVRLPIGWPLDLSVSPDYRVLLFCIGLSILTGIAFGLLPALRATRMDLVKDLKTINGSSTLDRFGLRNGLVVVQVAICTVLLVCMGLFLRSLRVTRGMDLGLGNRDLLLLGFDPGLDRRADSQSRQLMQAILDKAGALPGVDSATLTTSVPLTFFISNSNFVSEEKAKDPQQRRVRTDIYRVAPNFFATMGIHFRAGEDFRTDQKTTGSIAIVNDAFARAAFPDQSPLGQHVLGDGMKLQIVGVVATAKSRTIGEAPRPSIYVPILTQYSARDTARGVTLIVKTRDRAPTYVSPLREAIRSVDPSLAVFDIRTMESHLSDALIVPRLTWTLSAAAGSIGLVIAMIGMFGVISFAVIRRRRELGIRMAIGAEPREVLLMILRQGAALALVGTTLGLLISFGVTRFAGSLLYDVSPVDPLTFVTVPLMLMMVALMACMLPARAAACVDPVDVLRSE